MNTRRTAAQTAVHIRPTRGFVSLGLRELWQYRELASFLVWRDVKVRYAQTAVGVSWAVLQPLMTMAVFTVFFGQLTGVPSDGLPYPLFAFAALVPWTFFSNGLVQAANSLVLNQNLIKKVYFPWLAIPTTAVVAGGVDLGVGMIVLVAMMAWYGIAPSGDGIWLPAFLALAFIASLGAGLWLAALNVRFRDIRVVTPFLIQLWLLATPVAYPSSLIPEPWRTVNGLNPMAGVVEGLRWSMLGTPAFPGSMIVVSTLTALVVFIGGVVFFRRMERTFADRL